ncbi:MAG: diacylglycerol/lipid kinase family protein [Planctomycetota bacterium]|jgi:diacylglycerol kinase (ATP)
MNIELLANPGSGRGLGMERGKRIAELLSARGHQVGFHAGRDGADAADWAAAASRIADRLVVVGGDGTLSAVLDGLEHGCPPLAVSPLGTANLLAHRLKLSPRPEDTVVLVERGHTVPLDVATVRHEVDGEPVARRAFLCLGFGFDGELMRRMEAERQGPILKVHYLKHLAEALIHWNPAPQRVTADGEELGEFAYGILSGIGSYAAPQFRLCESVLDDGLWELVLFPDLNLLNGSLFAIAAAGGQLPKLPGVQVRRVREVRLTGPEPTPVQLDGDHVGATPLECVLDGLQVPVLVAS